VSSRIEKDFLGSKELPESALYGIHTARALENFTLTGRPVHAELLRAYGFVKWAAVRVNASLGALPPEIVPALEQACEELAEGQHLEHFPIDALQGGAGTSTNMAVNEVLANRALEILGESKGRYDRVHPLNHVNLHQSTNDTYPTALKVAGLFLLKHLEEAVIALQSAFQKKEKEFAAIVKVGRTQLQDATLITLGREFGAYADAIARDRWRIFKCQERLRVINLGGTAIGTGVTAPRKYIFKVVEELRQLTGLNLARAENLVDATQNVDVFAEVSGILKAHATSLIKIANDLRLLSSGPHLGIGEIELPAVQAGSSIMAGKVNPVIPEAVVQAGFQTLGSDSIINLAVASGNLELNPFLPLISEQFLGMLKLLTRTDWMFAEKCVAGIRANQKNCERFHESPQSLATLLVPVIGYDQAAEVLKRAQKEGRQLRDILLEEGLLTEEAYNRLISPENVLKLGEDK